MSPCRGLLLAALILLLPLPAEAQAVPARLSMVNMGLFWKFCGPGRTVGTANSWCTAYILGSIDAAITIGSALGRAPLCLTSPTPGPLIDRIITFMPEKIRGEENAGTHMQAAILRAMRCD